VIQRTSCRPRLPLLQRQTESRDPNHTSATHRNAIISLDEIRRNCCTRPNRRRKNSWGTIHARIPSPQPAACNLRDARGWLLDRAGIACGDGQKSLSWLAFRYRSAVSALDQIEVLSARLFRAPILVPRYLLRLQYGCESLLGRSNTLRRGLSVSTTSVSGHSPDTYASRFDFSGIYRSRRSADLKRCKYTYSIRTKLKARLPRRATCYPFAEPSRFLLG